MKPRKWQIDALDLWHKSGNKGIVEVATGGGKTIFAFMAFKSLPANFKILVIVPTEALLDQWIVNIGEEFGVKDSEIAVLTSKSNLNSLKTYNVIIINSARRLNLDDSIKAEIMLVVDECHRSGSYENAKSLLGQWGSTLGLSATPERQYDDGFERYIKQALGDLIFRYSVAEAINDGVLTPFELINIEVPLTEFETETHEKLTKRIAVINKQKSLNDLNSQSKIEVLLRARAKNYQNAAYRIPVTIRLMDNLHGRRTIIFHESISAVDRIAKELQSNHHSVVTYHSKISPKIRRDNLRMFRQGHSNVLVTCRALDEGLNVPETEVAIVSSATSSDRQRIQRLGRVLRPSQGKTSAELYTLFATDVEKQRLIAESFEMPDIVKTTWKKVQVSSVIDS